MLAIDIQNVDLVRRTQIEFSLSFRDAIVGAARRQSRGPAKRHVLRSLSLKVSRGEKVGIVGSNGSGKSTMLKLISGILIPTNGTVTVSGRVSPLIELGAGFDPDATVQDNVIYYGVLLGNSKAIMKSRTQQILAFAELGDRAEQPLKSLSSGMAARLAFAIATDSHPDVLLIDEIISVGDERFREKSGARMQSLWKEKTTILVVSHELGYVESTCERVVWLSEGTVAADGPPSVVLEAYRASMHSPLAGDLIAATS